MINGVTVLEGGSVVRDEDIATALNEVLTMHFGEEPSIMSVERRLAAYHSSFRLEEIDVVLADGSVPCAKAAGANAKASAAMVKRATRFIVAPSGLLL